MRLYPTVFRLLLVRLDPETAHGLGLVLIRALGVLARSKAWRARMMPDASLRTSAFGRTFASPFGLAAGFDKNGHAIEGLAALGFGHIEVGTVTHLAQPGNPRPRLFRLIDDRGLINRMGFNNAGSAAVARRLAQARRRLMRFPPEHRPVIGVNIGKTKRVDFSRVRDDYTASARRLAPHADYLVVNVSSPNTPGLRSLQNLEALAPLLGSVRVAADRAAGRRVPLLVKISPDLRQEDLERIADMAVSLGLEGVICVNTTVTREDAQSPAQVLLDAGVGGLSGPPMKRLALQSLQLLQERTQGKLTLISVGGVEDAYDVQKRLDAGATLVQGYTAFIYEGPFWASRINQQLLRLKQKSTQPSVRS